MRDSRNSVVAPGSSGNQRMRYSHAGAPSHAHASCVDFGTHAEQLGDVRVEARGPRAVRGERLEAVGETLVHDPLGRADRVAFDRDDGREARTARFRDHRRAALPASRATAACSVISGIDGSASPPPAARRSVSGAAERSPRSPRAGGGAGRTSSRWRGRRARRRCGSRPLRARRRSCAPGSPCSRQIAQQQPGVDAREVATCLEPRLPLP